MTRKQALAVITADAYENGKATRTGIRAYVETRSVGAKAFHEAVALGCRLRERDQAQHTRAPEIGPEGE